MEFRSQGMGGRGGREGFQSLRAISMPPGSIVGLLYGQLHDGSKDAMCWIICQKNDHGRKEKPKMKQQAKTKARTRTRTKTKNTRPE